ncbi:hypothetical protein ACFSKW_50390 [Nonomuraea mangrovi]|uniref:Uncharacterized protein n=1 Tax=Nonomuraea mangrovi TaxID=2316207 RepID=A0ABW4TCI4_9ACTN
MGRDAAVFTAHVLVEMREEMQRDMRALNDTMDGDGLPWLGIASHGRHGADKPPCTGTVSASG